MIRSVIILVHGVGQHEAKWADPPQEALRDAAKRYKAVFKDRFDDIVTMTSVHYDSIFEAIRKDWSQLAQSLAGTLPAATPSAITEYSEFLARITQDEDFASTHALDAVQYRAFPLIRTAVQLSVASQLARILDENRTSDVRQTTRFVIVAHSLGTAVVHDALELLATRAWLRDAPVPQGMTRDEIDRYRRRFGENPFSPEFLTWAGLVTIANVSKLFSDLKPGDSRSVVRPFYSGGLHGEACQLYINIDHEADPVTVLWPFQAHLAFPSAARELTADDYVCQHYYDVNPHGLVHYLRHPSVHARIFEALRPDLFPSTLRAECDANVAAERGFPKFGGVFKTVEDGRAYVRKLKARNRLLDKTEQRVARTMHDLAPHDFGAPA